MLIKEPPTGRGSARPSTGTITTMPPQSTKWVTVLIGVLFIGGPIAAIAGSGTGNLRWPWEWPWQSWCCLVPWTVAVAGYLYVAETEHD